MSMSGTMFGRCRAHLRRSRAGRTTCLLVCLLSLVALVSSEADAEEGARAENVEVDNGVAPRHHHGLPPTASPPAPVDLDGDNARDGGIRPAGASAIRFSAEDELHFSPRLVQMLRRPCEAYARNVLDEPALHLQHAAVIFLRHKCRHAPPVTPGQTGHACAELANAVEIDMTHGEAAAALRQLLHERCQAEAILLTDAETKTGDAARFLVKDTVRRVAEEELELRDFAGAPMSRENASKLPRLAQDRDDVLLLDTKPANERDGDDQARPRSWDEKRRDAERMKGTRVPRWGWDGPDERDGLDPTDDVGDEERRVELMVLTDLYRTTEGTYWRRQNGWLDERNHCAWEGVTCVSPEAEFGVLSLALPDNGLAGALPQTLARLHRLRHLDLSGNRLRGTVSGAFGSMSRLRALILRSNALYGKIPGELGAAAGLEQLDLSANHFAGRLPSDLSRLRELRMLNVSSNGLTGELPTGVCGLQKLEVLSVAKNRFSGDLAGPAAALGFAGKRSPLRLFDASENDFSGDPPVVPPDAPELLIWDVSKNSMRGTLPRSTPPESLRIFAASDNSLTGAVPAEMFTPKSQLRRLDLSGNALNGTLPDTLMSLTQIMHVNVSNNGDISGEIPYEGAVDIRAMRALAEFDASSNRLTGPLPPALVSLPNLRLLDLSNNELNGTLSGDNWADATRLERLNLRGNRLRGSIPPELGVLRGLTHLDLSGNELDGPVPVALVTASSLEHMDISGNSLDWSTVGRQGPRRGASDGEL